MSWEELERVVAARVLLDAFEASERLRRLSIPHALVGGLAVGHHGHPRATKDVDFIVGDEAFSSTAPIFSFRKELSDLVEWGAIDLLATTDDPPLQEALMVPPQGEIPIVPVPTLVLMKLRAGRAQDLADVSRLVEVGMDVGAVAEFLQKHGAMHVATFSAIAQRAFSSRDG